MAQNLNNATVAANNTNDKEEMIMMNKSVQELKAMAKAAGVKGYSKMKKADLVAAIQFFTDEERKANEAVVAPVIEELAVEVTPIPVVPVVGTTVATVNTNTVKEETTMNTNTTNTATINDVAREMMLQTLPNRNGKFIIKNVVVNGVKQTTLQNYSLFYRATKVKCDYEYMVVTSKLWGVISKVIENIEGKEKKTSKRIQELLEELVVAGMLIKVEEQRTYATLNPANMSQNEKDQLNGLWKTKDVVTEKQKDGTVKVTAVTDNGKVVLNALYPNYVYRANNAELSKMYMAAIQ